MIKTILSVTLLALLFLGANGAHYTGPVEMTFWRLCEHRLDKDDVIKARVEMYNPQAAHQNFLHWNTPWDREGKNQEPVNDILDISFTPCSDEKKFLEKDECVGDGKKYRVPYTGIFIKRDETPGVGHFVTLKPKKTIHVDMVMGDAYNMTHMGIYEIRYKRHFVGHFETDHMPKDHELREKLAMPLKKSAEIITSNVMKLKRVRGLLYNHEEAQFPEYEEDMMMDITDKWTTEEVQDMVKKTILDTQAQRVFSVGCNDMQGHIVQSVSNKLYDFVSRWLLGFIGKPYEKPEHTTKYFGNNVTMKQLAWRFMKMFEILAKKEEFKKNKIKVECHFPKATQLCDFHTFAFTNMTAKADFLDNHDIPEDDFDNHKKGWINICPDYFDIQVEQGTTNSLAGVLLHQLAHIAFGEPNNALNRQMTLDLAENPETEIGRILREANCYQYFFEASHQAGAPIKESTNNASKGPDKVKTTKEFESL